MLKVTQVWLFPEECRNITHSYLSSTKSHCSFCCTWVGVSHPREIFCETFSERWPNLFFFKIFFFLDVVDHFLKSLLNFSQYCLFYVLVFWLQGMWDLRSLTRDGPHTPCVGRYKVLTIGPPGTSPQDSQILKPCLKNFSGQNQNLPKFTVSSPRRYTEREKSLCMPCANSVFSFNDN